MAKSIKLKNNTYIDSSSVSHNRQKLSDILTIKSTTIQLSSGCTIADGFDTKAYVDAFGIVHIATRFCKRNQTPNAYTHLGTLPVGYRPKSNLILFNYLNEAGVSSFMYIDHYGDIYAHVLSGYVYFSVTVSYPTL